MIIPIFRFTLEEVLWVREQGLVSLHRPPADGAFGNRSCMNSFLVSGLTKLVKKATLLDTFDVKLCARPSCTMWACGSREVENGESDYVLTPIL